MIYTPHDYQRLAVKFALDRVAAGWFMDPGLGKTSCALLVAKILLKLELINRVLIIAPKRVMHQVWSEEIAEWDQFNHFECQLITGDPERRFKKLESNKPIHIITPDLVPWLHSVLPQIKNSWQLLIVDESTKFAKSSTQRFKALKAILPIFKRYLIFTGTPTADGLEKIWAQIYLLDRGERLGKNITTFRKRYFYRGGFKDRQWLPQADAQERIQEAIKDIVLRLDAKDHLDMPELLVNDIKVELPAKIRRAYDQLERDLFFSLESGGFKNDELPDDATVAMSSGAKYNLCKQVANGGIYRDVQVGDQLIRQSETVHSAKIGAIADLADELNGKPLLIFYQYKHDLERLQKKFGNDLPSINGSTSTKQANQFIKQWNDSQLPLLACQPQAMSHGLNLQKGSGRDIAWLGLTDSLDVYLQANARVWRQGVKGNQVRIHRILAKATVDQACKRRIDQKDKDQRSLLDWLREYQQCS